MTRDEVYQEIEQTIGTVPKPFREIPDEFIENEWEAWKHATLQETHIPNKWKQLVLLGMLVATGNEYGVLYRTESAKLHGATDEEIDEVIYLAKLEAGWLPFMKGHMLDFQEFKEETKRAFEHIRTHEATMGERASI